MNRRYFSWLPKRVSVTLEKASEGLVSASMATCLGVEHKTAWPLSPLDLWAGSFISDSVVHSHQNGGGHHSSIGKQLLRTGYFLVGN